MRRYNKASDRRFMFNRHEKWRSLSTVGMLRELLYQVRCYSDLFYLAELSKDSNGTVKRW
jgi:hypothetical protein